MKVTNFPFILITFDWKLFAFSKDSKYVKKFCFVSNTILNAVLELLAKFEVNHAANGSKQKSLL
jgi:hypothetical protein